jgi:hypothetical protein
VLIGGMKKLRRRDVEELKGTLFESGNAESGNAEIGNRGRRTDFRFQVSGFR